MSTAQKTDKLERWSGYALISIGSEGKMKSHLGWTACSVIAALGLMVTALTVEAQTSQNLVIDRKSVV